jgi:hypothetical protein
MRARTLCFGLLAAAALLASCSDDSLPSATEENTVDTLTLGAVWGTPVGTPSAYRMSGSNESPHLVRVDLSANYDFLFDIDSVDGPELFPAQATGVLPPSDANPGLFLTTTPFDSITSAKSNGYITDAPVAADSGDVFYLRSLVTCGIGVPLYGKLEILQVDTVARTMTFAVMVNRNCGYRELQPGLPQH